MAFRAADERCCLDLLLACGEFDDVHIDRVGCPAHAPLIADEPAGHVIELRVEIYRIAFGSAQHGGPFREPEFLLEHMKQTIHRIVLTGIGPDHQAIASEAFNLTSTDGYFKPAGLNPIAGHFDH